MRYWAALISLALIRVASADDVRVVPEPVGPEPPAIAIPKASATNQPVVNVPLPDVSPTRETSDPKSVSAKDDVPLLSLKWNDGVEFATKSKDFRYHIGGRTHLDSAWFGAPDSVQNGPGGVGPIQDGSTVRRARVRIDGAMYEVVEWRMEFDFTAAIANGNSAFDAAGLTDFYVELVKIPALGAMRVGNMKEPYGFEHLTSDRYLDFIERSPNYDAFAERFCLGYTPGAMLHNTFDEQRGTWWLGMFHDTNTPFGFGVGDQHYAWDARLTYLPLWDECGERWLHIAASVSHRNLNSDRVRLRTRPSLRSGPGPLTPLLADTGNLAATIQDLAGVELVAAFGPWTWQSEFIATWVWDASTIPASGPGAPLGNLSFSGWYTQLLYFLTGESRPYNRQNANMDRLKPLRNARWGDDTDDSCHGWGAWQIGARFSHTDLREGGVGAVIDDCTLGLNWYLNPNVKIQANYIVTHRSAAQADGWINGFGTRVAIDF